MGTAHEKMIKIINEQPADMSYDAILKELAFRRMVDRGLLDSKKGDVISHEEMGRRIKSWSG